MPDPLVNAAALIAPVTLSAALLSACAPQPNVRLGTDPRPQPQSEAPTVPNFVPQGAFHVLDETPDAVEARRKEKEPSEKSPPAAPTPPPDGNAVVPRPEPVTRPAATAD